MNISTREFVQTADDVMIGGFIIAGETTQRVIVRAIGPSFKVPEPLADPMLELYNGNGDLLGANDVGEPIRKTRSVRLRFHHRVTVRPRSCVRWDRVHTPPSCGE